MKVRIVLSVLALMAGAFLTGCGQPVPQNKVALVVRTLGERSVSNVTASCQIYWAERMPFGTGMSPGTRVFKFPLGLQDYSFCSKQSYESPQDDAIQIDCLGGHLTFDVNVQLYIERETPDLSGKLLQLINDHQLQSYDGEDDMLTRWAMEKLQQFVRQPLAQYALNKQAIDVMRGKAEMNRILLAAMNERFNKYAVHFSSAAIVSRINLPPDQKERMNLIVKQEYANRALELREKQYMPLSRELTRIEQDGLTQCQDAKNLGTTKSISIIAEAQKDRRALFANLVGEANYISLEQMMLTVKNLESSPTRVYVVPSTLGYLHIDAENAQRKVETK